MDKMKKKDRERLAKSMEDIEKFNNHESGLETFEELKERMRWGWAEFYFEAASDKHRRWTIGTINPRFLKQIGVKPIQQPSKPGSFKYYDLVKNAPRTIYCDNIISVQHNSLRTAAAQAIAAQYRDIEN